jgi:hypothetical protein
MAPLRYLVRPRVILELDEIISEAELTKDTNRDCNHGGGQRHPAEIETP